MKQLKTFSSGLLVLIAALLISCGGEKTFRSDKWEVTLHSSEYQKDFKYQTYVHPTGMTEATVEGLVVEFTCGYTGSDGLSMPPQVSLRRLSDKIKIDEFRDIVEQFSQFIRVHIQKFAPQRKGIDPDDILQEVKIKIWNILSNEKKIDNYASYIKKIVNSSVIDHLRRIRREERVLFSEMQRKIEERRSTYNI